MHVAPPLRILALDTTTPVQALATAEDSAIRGRLELRADTPHAETLLASVDRVLALSGWRLAELGAVAVVTGPGSFTGIRIGIATALGLADTLGIPVVGRNAMELLARHPSLSDGPVGVFLDARRGHIYGAVFHRDGERLTLRAPYGERDLDATRAVLAAHPGAALIGSAASLIQGFHEPDVTAETFPAGQHPLGPVDILAVEIGRAGPAALAGAEAPEAFYIRPPDIRRPKTTG
ncbi:MAG TPA: tRNA (adenosine(37)-N6)-threonylcarbamoyltransferase complex dimerization subunit type 1 TsaB [Acidobacteriota bacterium]|nr:tRNA (adenosine(37)-N6)-threonylcarbamoyltransferase complex dimerization subunit type 1 TsaB [Acidobacteriota bacterium]HQM63590.1 tRNA (adenosine(37)-N6)-threonylcarbamoyltransferase complex dimerization subunit type 1 TsaB [Acidobacteriota bacterium]